MRVLWTLLKVIVGLCIAIPLGLLVFALTLGAVGTLIGLTIMALRLAVIAFVGDGLYRLAKHLFAPAPRARPVPASLGLPQPDPYYEAAMRELDSELRGPARS